jgi:putative endopeptidase
MKHLNLWGKLAFGLLPLTFFACNNSTDGQQSDKKTVPALEVQYIDSTVTPGDDFFQFVNGGWLKANPVPDDKTSWGAFGILREENNEKIKAIIDAATANKNAEKGSNEQKIGDFYAAGMDTVAIEAAGISPLKPEFDKIAAIKTKEDVQKVAAEFQTIGVPVFFYLYTAPDDKNSNMMIAGLWQGGLGLPDRDYYTKDDERSTHLRIAYVDHLAKMFVLLGDDEQTAKANAEKVMEIETRLAKSQFTNLENRDPQRIYNKLSLDEIATMAPGLDWKAYLSNMGYPQIDSVNIAQTAYIAELAKTLQDVSIDDWKTFFRWKLINNTAPYLSSNFVNQNFEFNVKELSGQKQMQPRWKRVLNNTSDALGEAIGQLYVKEYFPPEAKQKMLDLVNNLRAALEIRINKLDWMSEPTKKAALEKLHAFRVKIGYPDKWKDYSKLEITKDSYIRNILAANKFTTNENLDKVGKPVDKTEWGMTPQTVNAYYNPSGNEIVFPAAILQPPFFNMNADEAVNYGAIGVVIGHEMSHGFDDQGSQYDKDGNLKNWWADEDAEKFKAQTEKLIEHFDGFVAIDSLHVDGKLTIGENLGDFGGLTISLEAFRIAMKDKDMNAKIDGFTPMERFFMSYATIWRGNMRDEELMRRLRGDVHSPGKYRVNGGLFNIPEFYETYDIKETDKLYRSPEQRPVIW